MSDNMDELAEPSSSNLPQKDELVEFKCGICNFSEKCKFGKLDFEMTFYKTEVFYMRDPFVKPDPHKRAKDYSIDDFLVIGALCSICGQQICIDETCGVYYEKQYCSTCALREKRELPDRLIKLMERKQTKSEEK